jgi:RHS repeat-associated protein
MMEKQFIRLFKLTASLLGKMPSPDYPTTTSKVAKLSVSARYLLICLRDDLITEAQGANFLVYYTQGQGLLSQRRNNASYFYHYDGLGSTKVLTDANQNIQNTTKYDAWGNILQASGTITNPYLYVGELGYYGDGDAGMYLLTQRWYNPLIGRFVVRDPLRSKKNFSSTYLNLYWYADCNPINGRDPLGLFTSEQCYEWYLECIRGAAEDVRECILDVMGHGWIPGLETVECTLTCGVACIASGPAWSGCMEVCLGACGWAFGAIDVIALKPCYEIAKIEKESCEDAYTWCCRHAE